MLVLPERIELSTSPLPRECSTTELRQRPVLVMSRRAFCRPCLDWSERRAHLAAPSVRPSRRAGSRSAGSHAYATRAPCISLGRAGADLSETFGIVLAP